MDDFIFQNNLDLVRVSTPEEAFSLLEEGKADYFIYSTYAGRKVIAESKLSGFKESATVSNQLFYVAFSKNSPYVKNIDMNKVNASLEKLNEGNFKNIRAVE
jgi:ABC-type amino acid transport substrate-binding protein